MLVWSALLGYVLIIKLLMGILHSDKKKKTFLFLAGVALVLVMGCRYATPYESGDLNNYYRLYGELANVPWNELAQYSHMEGGYLVLNKILTMIFPWNQTIIFVEAIICVYFTFRFIYKFCSDVFLGVLIYLTQGLLIFELTGFRQAIAISLCLFAVEFIKNKKIIWFMLITILACTFHSTAIVFFPFYFLAYLKLSAINIMIYGVIYTILLSLMPSLLLWGSNLTGSDYTVASTWGNFMGPLINISFHIIALVFMAFVRKSDVKVHKWKWNMTVLSLIIYVLRFISLPFERISFYFSGGLIVALPLGIDEALEKKTNKIVKTIIVLLSIVLYFTRFRGIGYRFFF